MKNAFDIVRDFEAALCEYTGAPYAVAVNSCTNALFLALKFYKGMGSPGFEINGVNYVEIPKRTYVSVPMQIIHAGYRPKFRDESWSGVYQLKGLGIFDAARRFTSNMFKDINDKEKDKFQFLEGDGIISHVCVSFHWQKILGIQQGGAILHNDSEFDLWARKARFDGRTEGVKPNEDNFDMLGYHMYMSPEIAAEGLVRLMHLPKFNNDLPNDDYPDLSQIPLFK